MSAYAQAHAAYRTAEVASMSQRDLIVRLYQGAESFLVQAQAGMSNKAPELAHANCLKAKRIFTELTATLNTEHGGDIAQRLKALYLFFIARISEANLRKDAALIAPLLPLIASLREAWQQVPTEFADTSSNPAPGQGNALDMRL